MYSIILFNHIIHKDGLCMHVFRQNFSRLYHFFHFCYDQIGSHSHHTIEIACIAPVKQIAFFIGHTSSYKGYICFERRFKQVILPIYTDHFLSLLYDCAKTCRGKYTTQSRPSTADPFNERTLGNKGDFQFSGMVLLSG